VAGDSIGYLASRLDEVQTEIDCLSQYAFNQHAKTPLSELAWWCIEDECYPLRGGLTVVTDGSKYAH
ncbi:unnamed protein product, partial [Prorocentrum cordatum]